MWKITIRKAAPWIIFLALVAVSLLVGPNGPGSGGGRGPGWEGGP